MIKKKLCNVLLFDVLSCALLNGLNILENDHFNFSPSCIENLLKHVTLMVFEFGIMWQLV